MQVASKARQWLQSVGFDPGLYGPVTERDGQTPTGSEGKNLAVTYDKDGARAPSPLTDGAAGV